jgi:hypothetical protein
MNDVSKVIVAKDFEGVQSQICLITSTRDTLVRPLVQNGKSEKYPDILAGDFI